jgi:T-complex protein 1 subunit zeta
MTGDGTTSTVLVIGEMLKQADVFISEGLHPRIIAEGFDQGRKKALEVLDKIKIPANADKAGLTGVARTALRTKLHANLADQLSDVN